MEEEPQHAKVHDGSSSKTKSQNLTGSSVSNTPRKRVSQACDRCRSRKDKCDGKKPVCSTCAALDQVCSYDPATKKRGLPEGYVRGLEKLWGLTIREAEGVEDAVLGILDGGDESGQTFETLSRIWNDREGPETLLETWRKSRISRELERLLPILDNVEEKPGKRKRPETSLSRAEGSTGPSQPIPQVLETDRRVFSDAFNWSQDDVPSIPKLHDTRRRRFDDASGSPTEAPNASTSLVELPSRTWQLLDVFFSYTHCWLPIIEKHDLLRTSYQYSASGTNFPTSSPGSGNHAALWAVLAYSDHQYNAIIGQNPEIVGQWTTESIYSHARNLIPSEDGVFEVGHIQALLVLVLLNMGRNRWNQSWLLIGQAVRIAVSLGLDQGTDVDPLQRKSIDGQSRSKHVFLGCFALDTVIAARLGRKPQLRKEDVERVGPVEEDGPDEWNPWVDCLSVRKSTPDGPHGPTALLSTYNRLILLFKILNSAICEASSGRKRVDHCSELMRELDSWGQVLPALLDPSSKPPLLPHRFHLHLAHISTMAVVYSHLSAYSKQMQVSDSTIAETFATTARQTMWLLLRQSEGFGLLITPPTYDLFTKIACESAIKVQDSLNDDHLTYKDWQRNMERSLGSMEKAWPTFEELRKSLTAELPEPIYHYQSPVSNGLTQGGSFDIAQHIPSPSKHPSVNENTLTFSSALNASPLAQTTPSYPRPGFNPLFNLAASVGLHAAEVSSPTWPDPSSGQTPFIDQPSSEQLKFPEGSLGSDIDGDSMFNDFATLDAMEWTNNWDQSLLNLGFANSDNMNQDFYAFCREPDPLYPNNLVHQLLSSSSNNVLPQMTGDFGDTSIDFENPHVEASHILQALSTAQGHSSGQGI